MSIIIGADIVPTEANQTLFELGDMKRLISTDLYEIILNADFRIFNLEVPLTDHANPIKKMGENLIASTASVAVMKNLGIDLFTLANNHIMDQDTQGFESTIQILNQVGIAHVGAGENLQQAQKAYFVDVQGKRYGIYACAEHEFSIAREDYPGANPFDPLESMDHIASMKAQCDFAIVLYHGGKEHYRFPSPCLQKVCRKIVEKGADLVICQHSHCIGCKEEYKQGTIIYGQGNFIFDESDNEYWNTSLLIILEDNGEINYLPIRKQSPGVRLATGNDAREILNAFYTRSEEIQEPGFVEKQYAEFAKQSLENYLTYFSGKRNRFFFRAINKLSGRKYETFYSNHIKKVIGNGIRNYTECEAHRELLLKGLE